MKVDYSQFVASIERTFIGQEKYLFDKYVPEFKQHGKFLGDCFVQTVVEPQDEKPPIFYHNFSPFDVISNKAPEQALVFEGGKLLLKY